MTRSVRRLDDLLLEASPADPPPAWALDDLALLRETQVLDVRVDAARSVAGVLLDSRQALAVPGGNAVLLVVDGLRDLRWRLDGVVARVHALRVSGGEATAEGRGQRLLLRCDPRAELVVLGARVAAHVVLVPGLPEAPVDYTEGDDDAIRAGTPSWDHGAEVLVSWELGGVAPDVRPGTST